MNPETLAFLSERSRERQRLNTADNIQLIKSWVRSGLHVSDDTPITVTELACADPSCPIRETVILVLTEPARQWKIGKPLIYVRKYDVAMALERKNGDGLQIRPHE
jgi:hypothetical protein